MIHLETRRSVKLHPFASHHVNRLTHRIPFSALQNYSAVPCSFEVSAFRFASLLSPSVKAESSHGVPAVNCSPNGDPLHLIQDLLFTECVLGGKRVGPSTLA